MATILHYDATRFLIYGFNIHKLEFFSFRMVYGTALYRVPRNLQFSQLALGLHSFIKMYALLIFYAELSRNPRCTI